MLWYERQHALLGLRGSLARFGMLQPALLGVCAVFRTLHELGHLSVSPLAGMP